MDCKTTHLGPETLDFIINMIAHFFLANIALLLWQVALVANENYWDILFSLWWLMMLATAAAAVALHH